nr:hypothetical protein [Saprospiraceae bacterium]
MDFDKVKYKVFNSSNWMVIHWLVNPGMAFNELVLGQRVPKIMLEDKSADEPRFERTYVPCPHCKSVHKSKIWSPQSSVGFGNWYG